MKNLKLLILLTIALIILLPNEKNNVLNSDKENSIDKISQISILPISKMASINGGSSGSGSCETTTGECSSDDCMPLSINLCDNSDAGYCSTVIEFAECRCGPGDYRFIKGCYE